MPGRPRTPFDRRYVSYCALCICVFNYKFEFSMCRIIWSLKAVQSMFGWTPELSPIDTSCDRACKYADVKWKNLLVFLETQDMKPDTRKSRNHRIPWPHPVFFAKAAHKLDCPIIAHLRIFLVVVVYSYCLVFIVNNFENVGSLKWPIFTFLIMNIERIEPFFCDP